MTSLDPNELPEHVRRKLSGGGAPFRRTFYHGIDIEELAAGFVAEDDNIGDLIAAALAREELNDPIAEIARTHPDQLTEREQRIRHAILEQARGWAKVGRT